MHRWCHFSLARPLWRVRPWRGHVWREIIKNIDSQHIGADIVGWTRWRCVTYRVTTVHHGLLARMLILTKQLWIVHGMTDYADRLIEQGLTGTSWSHDDATRLTMPTQYRSTCWAQLAHTHMCTHGHVAKEERKLHKVKNKLTTQWHGQVDILCKVSIMSECVKLFVECSY